MKHIPLRTCVGCRNTAPKKDLIRIVATPDGIVIDLSGKANGRGTYLHPKSSCWEKGIKGSLSNALKTNLSDKDIQTLNDFLKENLMLDQD